MSVTINVAEAISALEALGYTVTAPKSKATTKKTATAKTTPEPTKSTKVRTVGCLEQDGKAVRFVEGQFVPKKAWYGITSAIKEAGAKFDAKTKFWMFDTVKDAKAFMDKQAEREAQRTAQA